MQSFLKDRIWNFISYTGAAGIVALLLYLYNVEWEAISYTILIVIVWELIFGVLDYMRYKRRQKQMDEMYRRQLMEQKMEQESKERIEKQEMSDYYGMWVHQIKNPIAALKVLIQTQEEERTQQKDANQNLNAESVRWKEMKLEVMRIEQYVEMALTYLRMEEISGDLAFERYSLDEIVKQAVKKTAQMFILRKINLNYQPLEQTVLTDEKWMVFVLEQIISNALKYTKEGAISIQMEGDYLVVSDTGIGIKPEDLPRVFEKGFTGYNGRADKKATGIGLYLCKNIMDRLGQQIWIESEPGIGTRVILQMGRKDLDTRD